MSSMVKPSLCVLLFGIGRRPLTRSAICLTSVDMILESDDTEVSILRSCGTSVCVRRCVFRLLLWLKLRPHTVHLCGDSSICMTLWTARVLLWQNPLPHSLHLNGFSLLCMYLKCKKFVSSDYRQSGNFFSCYFSESGKKSGKLITKLITTMHELDVHGKNGFDKYLKI